MMEELFDVFDGADAQQAVAKPSKRKGEGKEGGNKKQKLATGAPAAASSAAAAASSSSSSVSGALDPAIEIAADAAREKLAAKAAAASAAATSAARAASGQLGVPADSSAIVSHDHAITEDDAAFYRYTEQHVSVADKIERADGRSALSEVCYPPGWDHTAKDASGAGFKAPTKPAKEYPFVLDPFQRYAVDCLERNQSVLVSAHTSAGKTVVAEYAIAMALRDGQRVIYTSPIKALSNQKYRELYEEFNDVGLMTGDVTINPSASCLVMTTEILRNMLYRGSEVMREAAFVIFDEVHYMRNKERGVVWEETIIMLPDKVRYVFLSATIPNGTEFALWIAKLHKQPCSVVYTDFRPTPLQHYLFPAGGDGLHLVVDEKGNFREDNFQKCLAVLKADPSTPGSGGGGGGGAAAASEGGEGGDGKGSKKKKGGAKPTGSSDIFKIVKMIMERQYQPVIIFSFSKRECETHALTMSKLDFSNEDEKKVIEQIFHNAIDALGEDDRHLPQVENILPLLRRGIGIHHGGLLPILKEVIEILFQEGLIKALFSTETFSMGLNMPCKTVVFTSVKKWDGEVFRVVTGGEYIQMSGRAGRRGLDDRGIVICMMDEQLEPTQCKEMIKGQADCLDSSFHLGYNMLLNLLRVEDQNPIKMIARSFLQFQNTRKAPALLGQLESAQAKREAMEGLIRDPKATKEYHDLREQLAAYRAKANAFITSPKYIERFLQPGRVLHIKAETASGVPWGWGVLISFTKNTVAKDAKHKGLAAPEAPGTVVYVLNVLLHCAPGSGQVAQAAHANSKKPKARLPQNQKPLYTPAGAATPAERGHAEYLVVPVSLALVDAISSMRMGGVESKDLKAKGTKAEMGNSLAEVVRKAVEKNSLQPTGAVAAPAAAASAASSSSSSKKKNKDKAVVPTTTTTPVAPAQAPVLLVEPTQVLPLLDPVKEMGISEESFLSIQKKITNLAERVKAHKLFPSSVEAAAESTEQLAKYAERLELDAQILSIKLSLKNATQDVAMNEQLKKMQVVLRRLEHTTADNVIDLKGRVACEISTCDELLATELMFLGVFNTLLPEQVVALCSALVFNEKNEDVVRLKEDLAAPLRQIQEAARRLGTVMQEAGLAIDVEEYVARFQPQLMEVVFAWCKGAKFSEVCKLTDIFEGTIIRCLRRLEELLRQFANAAKSVGNELLESKFTAGCALLKRDIVFAASLYL